MRKVIYIFIIICIYNVTSKSMKYVVNRNDFQDISGSGYDYVWDDEDYNGISGDYSGVAPNFVKDGKNIYEINTLDKNKLPPSYEIIRKNSISYNVAADNSERTIIKMN
ncbi:uncharacterized protein LOC111622408 [Centruroides sculpturatus]|uniref:uncharacterized protein LOC111622408 n=1 Tax=Centruroides sculpturatus TaxID=218467 RepID=UPI000C6D5C1E|nr:uncharacterized protein LOC111622408 [Centruroides sculpturatus]XP_023220553.1 uncharacterized protein LOC111622408 [Centruroides sculpturatus]